MRKLLLLFIAGFVMCTAACKKEHTENTAPDPETFPVQFSLSTFTQTSTESKLGLPAHTLADTLGNHVSYLYIRIYSMSDNKLVFSDNQTASSAAFGKIAVDLPQGNYHAVFVGSKSALQLNAGATPTLFNNLTMQLDATAPTPEIFMKKLSFSVTNTPLVREIRIDRMVAGLKIILTDAIPAGVKNIEVTIVNERNLYKFSDSTRTGSANKVLNFPVTASETGTSNKTLMSYVLRTDPTPTTVIIKAFTNTGIFSEKTVSNVNFFANKVTTLTGKLFSSQVTFDVTYNLVWGEPTPVVYF